MPSRRSGWSGSSQQPPELLPAAAERGHLPAAGAPGAEAAVENGTCVEARRLKHACSDRCTRAALADRHDRTFSAEPVLRGLSRGPVRQVRTARDEADVPLLRFPDVQQLDLAGGEAPFELVDGDRLELLGPAARAPAGDREDADRPEPASRPLRLGVVG